MIERRHCVAMVLAWSMAACHKAPIAATSPAAPPTASADRVPSCSDRPLTSPSGSSRGSLTIQAVAATPVAIEQFTVELIKDGATVCRTSTLEHAPFHVELYGLEPGAAVEVVVSAPSYLAQRRRVVPHAGGQYVTFYLATPGMQFFRVGGTPVPFDPARARHIVLLSTQPRGNQGNEALLRTFAGSEQLALRRTDTSSPRWYAGLVGAEVTWRGNRDDRRRAIKQLHAHLRSHPEQGQLVLLINEYARGGTFVTGELVLTCPQGCDQTELATITARHDLELGGSVGSRVTLRMNVPDVDFAELAAQIGKDHPSVTDVEPQLDGPLELDHRGEHAGAR